MTSPIDEPINQHHKKYEKESKMTKLNCGVGNLAITVTCNYPENPGKIVQILKPVGFKA